ncbi:hypothetical protein [Streptomyces sp. CCM_MD2014]|uniref:hypothetical protein n=1 Tax=Streptomyces sp. CCM_MD2014 TaxID=1561022 RepID=UPI00052AA26B|nr:hypothetical protein [Streptomyces sp. CCM_MD2014]AIV34927.1 hypothetical protein NI25_16585 [Streptomyces sp. CCM_MD2014]
MVRARPAGDAVGTLAVLGLSMPVFLAGYEIDVVAVRGDTPRRVVPALRPRRRHRAGGVRLDLPAPGRRGAAPAEEARDSEAR